MRSYDACISSDIICQSRLAGVDAKPSSSSRNAIGREGDGTAPFNWVAILIQNFNWAAVTRPLYRFVYVLETTQNLRPQRASPQDEPSRVGYSYSQVVPLNYL